MNVEVEGVIKEYTAALDVLRPLNIDKEKMGVLENALNDVQKGYQQISEMTNRAEEEYRTYNEKLV